MENEFEHQEGVLDTYDSEDQVGTLGSSIGYKYHITNKGIKNEKGELIPPDEPIVLFRARDALALHVLVTYESDCIAHHVHGNHIAGVRQLITIANGLGHCQKLHSVSGRTPTRHKIAGLRLSWMR